MLRDQENNPIYNCIKKNRVSMNKFNQGGKRLYTEKYKTLIKRTEEETNINCKIFHAHGLE